MKSLFLFTITMGIGLLLSPANLFASRQAPLQLSSPAATQIEDIIGPVLLPASWPWATTALIVTALLSIILALFFYRRGKRRKTTISPAQIALEKIARLDPTLEGGERVYLTAISDILRHYIEGQLGIRSTKQTTREFLRSMELQQNSEPAYLLSDELKSYLPIFDQAKFAHQLPQHADISSIKNAIITFITETESNSRGGDI